MAWLLVGTALAALLMLFLHWWANTDTRTARQALFIGIVVLVGALGLMLLASGRGFAALVPVGFVAWRMFADRTRAAGTGQAANRRASMSRAEALEVLGLEEGVREEEINAAYRKLMAQVHPDKGGSDWMAAKLNEARRVLLGK